MKITAIRSDAVYAKMAAAPGPEKERLYRAELMRPFAFKWQCLGVPLEAENGGYDAAAASAAAGCYHPSQITPEHLGEIGLLHDDRFWQRCEKSIRDTLEGFERNGISLPVQEYCFTILLGDPESPMAALTGDYCGDGGIPGFLTGTIIPNENSLKMLPAALAHEANHNVRWQFLQWGPQVTLADMLVCEGLAENFAAMMFGPGSVGPWVKNTSGETLERVIKPAVRAHLQENDFQRLSAYLYGDEVTALRGGAPVGMPHCAGYACGYALIRHYLEKTGQSIYAATVLPAADILKAAEDFWR